ncbi:gamma-glutamyltransferase family protein [Microlunatus soli]|uniref:Gamma-glutamyltranspeptidase / glutathione hydrolase n=1 Tax=Microlunatus soli TaxID=630515 RepID=A0A1H1PAI6_9ACTN|nr:gamma-glutamyltransferase [Microlunatus soli]SDS08261.1 gamma-glutamyltranspeptidase / glutathione hydrolase [Microlunatus soli]
MTYTPPAEFTTRPDLRGSFGMVASTHWLASSVGQAVLEQGGNAYDAAVATGFVLHLVEPHLNGPGGDMVGIAAPVGGPARVLCGQGPAPAGATIEHYRSEGLDLVPGAGGLAAAVPGAVDAWLLLARDHGTMELADLWAYTIDYAERGYPLVSRVAGTIGTVAELFTESWTSSADFWLPGGQPVVRSHRNPAYADVLRRLLAAGQGAASREDRIEAVRTEWAQGFVAEEAAAFLAEPHRHSDGHDHAAVITAADFAGFGAGWETPASIEFRGHTVLKSGQWGQGPVLLQALRLLDGFTDDELDPQQPAGAHTILEALKLAMADRDAYYGDPGTAVDHGTAGDRDALLQQLLSTEYADRRRREITDRAIEQALPGRVDGWDPYPVPVLLESATAAAGVGEPTVRPTGETRGDTCHLDIVDRWGNMISATPSGGWLQSSPHIPSLGFCLGTRLQMTWLDPASPSALTPGRRPRTTLTPTVLLTDGVPTSALGSPGGDQQDQWQLSYLLRTLVGGYSGQQAIDAPSLHTTALAGSFWPRTQTPAGAVVEDRLGADVIGDLERRGHRVTRAGDWALGRLSSVSRDPRTGELTAAANPRGAQGYAVGR